MGQTFAAESAVLTQRVEQWINQRTWGRLRDLNVRRAGDRVIVRGHAGSYYQKQLALAAAMETVDPEMLIVDIDVPSRDRRQYTKAL